MADSGWIKVASQMPTNNETVWGFDCYYSKEGPCVCDGKMLEFLNGDDDCFIVLWRPMGFESPSAEEIEEAFRLAHLDAEDQQAAE